MSEVHELPIRIYNVHIKNEDTSIEAVSCFLYFPYVSRKFLTVNPIIYHDTPYTQFLNLQLSKIINHLEFYVLNKIIYTIANV